MFSLYIYMDSLIDGGVWEITVDHLRQLLK